MRHKTTYCCTWNSVAMKLRLARITSRAIIDLPSFPVVPYTASWCTRRCKRHDFTARLENENVWKMSTERSIRLRISRNNIRQPRSTSLLISNVEENSSFYFQDNDRVRISFQEIFLSFFPSPPPPPNELAVPRIARKHKVSRERGRPSYARFPMNF